MKFIDLNADLGEGFSFDESLLKIISSCNIACGGHAGDENSMATTILLAKKYNVTIGAHPSYPDKKNFGRTMMKISSTQLIDSLLDQINQLLTIGETNNATIRYIKPHGALYNRAMNDKETAASIITSVKEINIDLAVMGIPNSELEKLCSKENIQFIKEGFADRRYNSDGSLVNRTHKKAVIHQKGKVWMQIKDLIEKQKILSIDNELVPLSINSICFHGDTPKTLELLEFVTHQLKEIDISIKSYI
ncbi:5-oxoprolinase subunit PxpA [Flammeovirga pectinis]|uniref:5-oxoprolinase subunit PxpA n=1 Tax=Flammeovirga pectinis TaxID=2494373 RepID=UPI0014775D7E|nr:5-oxoprolinase subunit PxpA [Flammeovirga pectinis]